MDSLRDRYINYHNYYPGRRMIVKGMGALRYERGPHKGAIHLAKGSKKAKAYMQFVRSFRRKK